MRIGIIGSGHIGGTLARLLVGAGDQVVVSNSRGPESLQDLAAELGESGRAATAEEAARFGDLVVVSIPFGRYRELPAEALAGRVVIDTDNYYPARDGHFEQLDSGQTTGSQILQDHLSSAKVVKAFNAIQWESLAERGRPEGDPDRLALPIAGDDPEAKKLVGELIRSIGFDVVDAGPLGEGGRKFQVGAPLYGQLLSAGELATHLEA